MKKHLLAWTVLALTLCSCSTYYLSLQSLKEQLEHIYPYKINDACDFRLGLLGVAMKGGMNFYNGIEFLQCKDKRGNDVIVTIKPQTGIRMTDNSGRKIQLYFDSVF